VVVRINDRGPFIKGRIIDLSLHAARQLEMIEAGVTRVRMEIVADGKHDHAIANRIPGGP
jgi:rare lipoprotein A